MADSMMSYAIAAGIFAFLTAILFASRAQRLKSGHTISSMSGENRAADSA